MWRWAASFRRDDPMRMPVGLVRQPMLGLDSRQS